MKECYRLSEYDDEEAINSVIAGEEEILVEAKTIIIQDESGAEDRHAGITDDRNQGSYLATGGRTKLPDGIQSDEFGDHINFFKN